MAIDKQTKYIKKYLEHFVQTYYPNALEEQTLEVLIAFLKYERLNCHTHQSILSKDTTPEFTAIVKEFLATSPEGNLEDFTLGLKTAATILEHKLTAINFKLDVTDRSLKEQKRKNKNDLYAFKSKLEALEYKLFCATNDTLTKMEAAYKAGQNSCELHATPITELGSQHHFVKRLMNFKTWANQIWKYGKVTKPTEETSSQEEPELGIAHQFILD
jgi:hypothetical protein